MEKSARIPKQKIGSYTLLEKLGSGGIGEVWKARDARLNRIVALKFVSAEERGSSSMRDLLREARAASALNHPNIVSIFEVGEAEGPTYIVMEFVEGETLRARLTRSPVPLDEALEIATQVARGLAVAHQHGIVHRDLKPENIMLRADGYVKLVDFGLAKLLPWGQTAVSVSTAASVVTETGRIVGTFNYLSPEQARGLTVTPASDVFSFGIILYELLAGENPFRAETPLDTLTAILTKDPPRVTVRNASVPTGVQEVLTRALQKDSNRRFSSASELADELKRIPRPGPAVSAQPIAGTKPRWMQAIGMSLIALLLLVAIWFVLPVLETGDSASQVRSVAIMAFQSPRENASATVLAQGLVENLGSELTRAGWRVASRRSVLQWVGPADPHAVGQQLGVESVLEGNIRDYGNIFRVHIELVSARTGFQIWSGTFTVGDPSLLSTEEEVAAEVATQLHNTLGVVR